jgi:hypothetical protein
MQVTEIIAYILSVVFPALFVWNMMLQSQIGEIKTEVAVNSSKDQQLEAHVLKMEDKLDNLLSSVNEIKERIAASGK